MSRSRAAWLAGVVTVLLAGVYLLTRRARSAPVVVAGMTPVPVDAVPPPRPSPAPVPVPVPVRVPASPEVAATPASPAGSPARTRSWSTDPAEPDAPAAPTEPTEPPAAAAAPPVAEELVEQPLPTWVRLAIVAAALLAFFAVSLIATKQV
jgi:hypothetical protein